MTKIVHVILIDSVAKVIKVVRIDPEDNLGSAYRLIGCELIEAATRLPNGDVVYVDEEGRLNGAKGRFMFNGQMFIGRGLIVNEIIVDEDDGWTAPRSPFMELITGIEFEPGPVEPPFSVAEILASIVRGKFKVMETRDYEAFAGANPGSLICYDMEQWTVIVSPGNAGDLDKEAISVHAYLFPSVEADGPQDEANYELTIHGWQEI